MRVTLDVKFIIQDLWRLKIVLVRRIFLKKWTTATGRAQSKDKFFLNNFPFIPKFGFKTGGVQQASKSGMTSVFIHSREIETKGKRWNS